MKLLLINNQWHCFICFLENDLYALLKDFKTQLCSRNCVHEIKQSKGILKITFNFQGNYFKILLIKIFIKRKMDIKNSIFH